MSFTITTLAQNENLQLGSSLNNKVNQGGLYDYSDPSAVNIKVSVWGFVRYPGKYIIPIYCNMNDLISFAGGPTDEAKLDELRILRGNSDSVNTIIKVNYKDFLFDPNVTSLKSSPHLKGGDILLVSGAPRFYFKDYLGTILSIVSVIISIIILVRQK
jgi:hypothetical protein